MNRTSIESLPAGAFGMRKFPSASVIAPPADPMNRTRAPSTGSPVEALATWPTSTAVRRSSSSCAAAVPAPAASASTASRPTVLRHLNALTLSPRSRSTPFLRMGLRGPDFKSRFRARLPHGRPRMPSAPRHREHRGRSSGTPVDRHPQLMVRRTLVGEPHQAVLGRRRGRVAERRLASLKLREPKL